MVPVVPVVALVLDQRLDSLVESLSLVLLALLLLLQVLLVLLGLQVLVPAQLLLLVLVEPEYSTTYRYLLWRCHSACLQALRVLH